MTTSNTTTFDIDMRTCIQMTLEIINVIGEGDRLENDDYIKCKRILNLMLKHWQAQDYHLWVKQTATLFLQNSQNTYTISDNTNDHFTADSIVKSSLATDYLIGSSTITVASTSGMNVNDYIGIAMNNLYLFWTTIQDIPVAGTILLASPITYAASSGANVFTYTNKLKVPFQVYAMNRRQLVSNVDIPLNIMSYREYFDMPTKLAEGVPVSWAYDRQKEYFTIFTWPTYKNVDYYLRMIVGRKIQDVNVNSDNFDLPQEWGLTAVYNLAVLVAPSYGKAQGENFAKIESKANQLLAEAMNIDNELGSIYMVPTVHGYRRP